MFLSHWLGHNILTYGVLFIVLVIIGFGLLTKAGSRWGLLFLGAAAWIVVEGLKVFGVM
ncbi:MAG: hypothetical protein Kow0059_12490 [Candidatus Sumerlaeia bacterium]